MPTIRDLTLARLAEAAFRDAPGALPGGFQALGAPPPGVVADAATESFANGVYRSGNAAALVASGTLGGLNTLVLAFRGADDRQDSINVLQNPAADYATLAELVRGVDALAASGAYQQLAITGHSLGGSLVQLYMAAHPAGTTKVLTIAATFGSPGALIPDSADQRITNFVVVDDPAVFLGENREAVGDALDNNPVLARAAAELVANIFPGITTGDALNVVPSLTADYENAGRTEQLSGKAGAGAIGSVAGLLRADPGQHSIALYVREMASGAFRLPGSGDEPLFDPGYYLGRNADLAAAGVDPKLHFDSFGWREGRDASALFDTDLYLRTHPDVAAARVNPLVHYETFGWREGRDPNAFFDGSAYLAANRDVAAAGIDPLVHYVLFGWSEGRDPGPAFDTSAYLLANPDVTTAGVNPLQHYLDFGLSEGRLIA